MSNKNTPVLLLTGYLGSGKTTLLNRILSNRRNIRFAVIVNDIGEVNIDADLIQKGGVVGIDDDLVALQNGCICCTLKMDLVKQLCEIVATGKFDYIVVEASGICEPEPIAQTIVSIPSMVRSRTVPLPRLDCIVTVVDALRMYTEFASGDALAQDNLDEEDIENLIIQQIEFCNIILLNKIDEVTKKQAEHIKEVIRAIQPKAKIIECNYGDVDLDKLLDTHMFDFEDVATSATWVREIERPLTEEEEREAREHHHHHEHAHHHEHEDEHHHEHHHDDDDHSDCDHEHGVYHHHHHHDEGEAEEYGIQTFVYYRRAAFDLNRFDDLAAHWPASIIRTKGVVYFKQSPDMSYLFEQAGVQVGLKESGKWFATAPQEDIDAMLAADAALRRDWDPVIGDRMIKLVIIGRKMDREAITAELDSCLAK